MACYNFDDTIVTVDVDAIVKFSNPEIEDAIKKQKLSDGGRSAGSRNMKQSTIQFMMK